MTELLAEEQSEQLDFDRYVDLVRRRHVLFLALLFLTWAIVWGVSWILPTSYRSSTLILVEQPTMPSTYVAPNVTDNLQERLQSITQQILSRTRLLTIINRRNLYNGGKSLKTPDDKIEAMRKDISIDLVRDARNNSITAFKVSFAAHDPALAQDVTNQLTQLFINENLKVRQEQSEGTTRFIERQLEDARTSLAAQEAKIRQFEAAHEGALPNQEASNLQILSGLQSQLQNQQDSLNTAKQQRVYYQSQLDQYKALHETGRTVDGVPTDLTSLNQELAKLKSQLTDLSSHYTDSYPDVQKVKAQIARTERQRQELLAAPKVPGAKPVADAESSPLLQLQSQLQANHLEIASRESAIGKLEARIGEYQARLNLEPATEQQLADLTRGYEQSKLNYDDLLKKKNQSVMATSMEQMQQGERFTVLDPPSLPAKPDFPNRLKFCGMGVLAGLALGAAAVLLIEFFEDRMFAEKDIRVLLPISVIAEIPEVDNEYNEQKVRRKVAWGWTMAGTVTAFILIGSAVSVLRG